MYSLTIQGDAFSIKSLGAVAHAFHRLLCLEQIVFRDPERDVLLLRMSALGCAKSICTL
jgi:hypothetical protein